jgi:hypothetical protein
MAQVAASSMPFTNGEWRSLSGARSSCVPHVQRTLPGAGHAMGFTAYIKIQSFPQFYRNEAANSLVILRSALHSDTAPIVTVF